MTLYATFVVVAAAAEICCLDVGLDCCGVGDDDDVVVVSVADELERWVGVFARVVVDAGSP